MPLGIQTSMYSEIMGFIFAVELSKLKGWFSLWIESNSTLLVAKVKSLSTDVPWGIRHRWRRCLWVLNEGTSCITHVYRERNQVANKLANVGMGFNRLYLVV